MRQNPLTQAIIKACTDEQYRKHLLADPAKALADEGLVVPEGLQVMVHEPADDEIVVVLPGGAELETVESPALHGPVADVPTGLTLTWRQGELLAVGRIDSVTAPAIKRELLRAFEDVSIDMSAITFLSSAGLSALLAGYKHLQEHQATLTLLNVTEEVRSVLEMVGFLDLLQVVDVPPIDAYAGWAHL